MVSSLGEGRIVQHQQCGTCVDVGEETEPAPSVHGEPGAALAPGLQVPAAQQPRAPAEGSRGPRRELVPVHGEHQLRHSLVTTLNTTTLRIDLTLNGLLGSDSRWKNVMHIFVQSAIFI